MVATFCGRDLNEFYHAPYRQTMARAARDEEDFFMLLMFAESLGIDNPASFYTLELQPLFLENFHEWHTRIGVWINAPLTTLVVVKSTAS